MMILFQALTSWKLSEEAEGLYLEPALSVDYPLNSWSDVTGQAAKNLLPKPNLFAIQATADEKIFTDIQADARYLVLWSKQVY